MTVGGKKFPATVRWDATTGRYRFESPALQRLDFQNPADLGRELVTTINADQLLRVVPTSPGCVYVHGQVIGVPDPHTDRAARRLLERITTMDALKTATEEKGKPVADGWNPHTVFGIIDKLASPSRRDIPEMSKYFANIETLVCTDMGTEPCDFIAMQPDRIAFIHAKHGGGRDGTKRSAKVLHEVTAQAIKNLIYLMPTTHATPPFGGWDIGWPAADHAGGTVPRLRTSEELRPEQLWDRAHTLIDNVTVYKEVWIVLGKAMSLTSVRSELAKEHPADEMIQIYALLQSTASAVAEVGAQLRIFCSP